ncbi:MAG TPA: TonB-dependent receptor plug domain-containing protein [Gemmatirosa sp.]
MPPVPPPRSVRGRVRAARATTILALAAGPGRVAAQAGACTSIPLRDALDRIAADAHVRLSYSRELLDVDRAVCAPAPSTPALTALGVLLRGTGIEAVAVGDGQIVLAPSAHATGDGAGSASRPTVLDRVVVTGSAAGAPSRALPVALTVVDGTTLGARTATSTAAALDGVVPGLWVWTQPTTSLLARYAGLRGASSFGLTTPKLYIDGVEVANPLFVTSLVPDQIERIEVLRGPQGAALYGADAISGVINIVTRHDGAVGGGRDVTVRTGVGAAATAFAPHAALAQDLGLTVRSGSGAHTDGLSIGLSALGPAVPGRTAYQITALGDARRIGPAGVLTLTARVADEVAPPSDTTGLGASVASSQPLAATQHLTQVTLAANGVRTAGERWTQTLTAGIDAYHLAGVSAPSLAPLPAGADTTQQSTRGTAARGTLRASTTATFDASPDLSVTVTGIADYGLLRDATQVDSPYSNTSATAGAVYGGYPIAGYAHGGLTPLTPVTWLSNAGLVGQTTLAWHDALFVTAGLRGERNDGFTAASRTALLPSLGISTVQTFGGATLKLRGAYGSGLRPARSEARAISWHAFGGGALPTSLAPESQTGVEGGADLFLGRTLSDGGATTLAFHVTGFDQRASGLIQQVALDPDGRDHDRRWRGWSDDGVGGWTNYDPGGSDHGPKGLVYELQNVGAISNRGVEGETQLRAVHGRRGVLTLGATVSYVDSRVTRTATGYSGELRAGDRVLEVPRWTLGATANWRLANWTATLGVARAANWINYDRIALAQAVAAGRSDSSLTGPALRAYWHTYAGDTRLRADLTRDLTRGFSIALTGENLLGQQRGEPDNLTTLPGRILTAGFRAHF